ncbi:hypothetical protein MPTK1_8g18040 [Marchantia polymorpha subsp. ruderalis]|uniref:Rieske domain-containing protein n=2 Tax=Marchantia polymorpha TaxID=3197 RepID=A0A176WUF7_MARPO|nr:hypothetical protein AXG93_879s1120 [Marchantia polymorpha subsp. ruderalis]PTQ42419.1 hypothetical protein MARPO_0030s0137 [Marchantia polymorpha]BBN20299.1 hypothetical protein Mp_8g18040 [Marchantia polymorpha subsp. ruderalis]|eukprot:PTQ42419.1 hypothetical protein MARPO_0030s0137 [Marchantia polymorpha]
MAILNAVVGIIEPASVAFRGERIITGKSAPTQHDAITCRLDAKCDRGAVLARSEIFGCAPLSSVSVRSQGSSRSGACSSQRSRKRSALCAIADGLTKDLGEIDESARVFTEKRPADGRVNYNWEEQWYPLFLTREVPKDAPLGLTVYDRNLVVFYDGDGKINCLEDRCPHRAAKLSEGQLMDGMLECLYHGWQFQGDGSCTKIPQLAPGAKIPRQACARSYALKDSQGVLWVWMADHRTAPYDKVPYFDHYEEKNYVDFAAIHELPYDYSVLVENVLDPAHIQISHDGFDGKREKAQPMVFNVTERTDEGFAGTWNWISTPDVINFTRFQAPCVAYSDVKKVFPDGVENRFSATALCRPAGQGKSILIIRFGSSRADGKKMVGLFPNIPLWCLHVRAMIILEQDLGFLSSQSELLVRERKPTKDIYLNLRSQDVWIEEYRKWLDKVGHGMPYYHGHRTFSPAAVSAVEEASPAGLNASMSSTHPAKGAFGHKYTRDPTNRYFRHVIYCKPCRTALRNFERGQKAAVVAAAISAGLAILMSKPAYRVAFVALAFLMGSAYWACSLGVASLTENWFRKHKSTL